MVSSKRSTHSVRSAAPTSARSTEPADTRSVVESAQPFPLRHAWTVSIVYFVLTLAAGIPISVWDTNSDRFNDANVHWARVQMILAGHILPIVNPDNGEEVGYATNGQFVTLNNTAINSPFTYWPSLLSGGNRIAASVLTVVCSAAIIAVAIRLAGRFQFIMFGAAIIPMTFLSLVYPTADAVTNSTSLLFIGLILYILQQPQIRWTHWLALCVLAVALGQIKITCGILVLLVLLLAGKLHCWHKLALLLPMALTALSSWLWSRQVSWFTPTIGKISYADYVALRQYSITHPLLMLKTVVTTMFMPLNDSTETIHGVTVNVQRNLQLFTGTESTQLGNIIMVPVLLAVVLLVVYSAALARLRSAASQVVIVAVILIFFAATVVAMSISWAASIGGYADGIQTRYFIPLLPLFSLLFPRFFRCENPRLLLAVCAVLILWSYIGIVVAYLW